MARYIDADNFRKTMIKRFGCVPCLTDYSEASRHDIPIDDALNLAPTADVAPRAEVANKICCEIEEEIVAALESNYRALKEWDDGRCNDYILEMVNRIKGKIDALRGIEAFVEELKNKYAEGQTNESQST